MIGSGSRNSRVTLIKRVPSPGALGPTFAETVGKTYWAQVVELDARERRVNQSLGTAVTHRIIFNGAPDIDYAVTEFEVSGKRLQPTGEAMIRPRGYLTVVECKEVTEAR